MTPISVTCVLAPVVVLCAGPHTSSISRAIEFDSMINLRQSFGNRSRGIGDAPTREQVAALVASLVRR